MSALRSFRYSPLLLHKHKIGVDAYMKKIFTFCKSYLMMHKWQLSVYIILSAIAGASGIINPYIVGSFIDQVTAAEDISFIPRYFATYVTVNVAALLLGYVSGRLYVRLQAQLGYSLNRDFIMRIQRMPINFTQRQDSAYLNQRINNDANSLIIFCISIISNILINLIIVVVPSILLFTFNPFLAAVLLVVAVVYFVLYRIYRHVLYNANFAFQESRSVFFAKLNEQISRIRFIKLHGLFDNFILRLNKSFAGLLDNALRHQRASYIFTGLDKTVTIAAQLTMFLFGGIQIIAGNLTIGQFVITSIYFGMILGALRYFFSLGQTVQSNMVAYDRLQELAQRNTEINGGHIPLRIDSIEIKNIKLQHRTWQRRDKILDEPTSALDAASNDVLKQYLQDLKKRKIIIVVTHDMDFIGEDDIVIQLGEQTLPGQDSSECEIN